MSPQSSIAHYRILSKLGEGGMGAVYRATDTKLNRDVAIKVLPDAFANDADRLARFTREAQVLASLNHPNIAAIYGVEERALVMELVDGGEPRGPMEEAEALPIVSQLIDALEYAHERGVVHRDLKPANIKVTPEAKVKVLDFGLAKAISDEKAAGDPMSSPTLTMRATLAGTIMGTAAYMAPEQARGQNVDKRADIWAFGAVVYELLAGRQLFQGATVSDTLASVLRQEIDLTSAPARFRRLLSACLERDARRRLRDIGDARRLLEETVASPVAVRKPARAPWIAAGLAILVAAACGVALWRRDTAPRPLSRFSVDLGPDSIDSPQWTALLSPDGRRLLFRTPGPGGATLAIRALDQPAATRLTGTEGVSLAFFSPDGDWIGFFADGKLKKIAVTGGATTTICDSPDPHGAAWLPGGGIVSVFGSFTLARVPDSGGTIQQLGTANELTRYPQALDGDRVLFTAAPPGTLNFDNANLDVMSIKTGERKTVLRGGYFGRYLPSGHLLYVRGTTIYAVRFNLARAETVGAAIPLFEGAGTLSSDAAGHFDFSNDGTFVYVTAQSYDSGQHLALLDASGAMETIPDSSGISLRVSPDGKRLVFSAGSDLTVHDFARNLTTRITFDPSANNRHPVWTPDGRYIAFAAAGGVWWTRADGSGKPVRILEGDPPPTPWSMIAAGPRHLRLAFHQAGAGGVQRDIYVLPLDVSDPDHPAPGKPEVFLATPVNETDPMFSPDGRWLAYVSGDLIDPANSRLYVRRYVPGQPASGGQWQVSDVPARIPVWSGDGKQLFYCTRPGQIMVADVAISGDSVAVGKSREWSPTPILMMGVFQDFDMLPGGKRAVIVALPEPAKGGAVTPHVNVLLNFFDELKRRLP